MKPRCFLGIYSAICLIMIQQITAQRCDTEVVSFEQFRASSENSQGNAVMSSQLHSYSPENCMDRNEDTFCHTEREANPYFMIEYSGPRNVTEVKVTARKSSCCYQRVKQLVVVVTDTEPTKGKSALESGTQLGSTFVGPATSAGQEITFSSSGGVRGQYVVIQQLYEGVMNLAEVRGLCVISGVCSEDQTNDGQSTGMDRRFDLHGSFKPSRRSKKTPSDTKETCFKRASDYFKECKNNMINPVTATFYGKNVDNTYRTGLSNIFPPAVSTWKQTKSDDCWSGCGTKGGACPSLCGSNGYCCRKGFGGCPPGAGDASPKMHTCVAQISE